MHSTIIEIGNKIDIRIVNQIENAEHTGELPHIYKSQLLDFFDNGEAEILMPSESGKLRLLQLGIRYEFVFYTKNGLYRCYGEVKERYKSENKFLLRVSFHTQLSKYQRREYYRLPCVIEAPFYGITKEIAMLDSTEEIEERLQEDENLTGQKMKAYILDISGGGVRFVAYESVEEDSYILIYVKLGTEDSALEYPIVGRIISSSKVEDVTPARYEHRVEFILKDSKVRENIIRFIFTEERKARSNRKG